MDLLCFGALLIGSIAGPLNLNALFLLPVLIGLGILSVWVIRLLKRDERMRVNLAAAGPKYGFQPPHVKDGRGPIGHM